MNLRSFKLCNGFLMILIAATAFGCITAKPYDASGGMPAAYPFEKGKKKLLTK